QSLLDRMRVAIIGQSMFAGEVYKQLMKDGHKVVGVFTVPDQGTREDPLASMAAADDVKVFKFKSWRKKGVILPEVLEQYLSVDPELNVMPFCSQFIPMEVINHPKNKSICYHPSILPRHRGASSINWTLMCGDKKGGFSIFWADDGLDTGPILLQREVDIDPNDTVDTLYNRFMYPEGIKAMAEAVCMVVNGNAPVIPQPTEGATYDPMLNKHELCKINWDQPAENIHNFIRGLDSSPGAWMIMDGKEVKVFGSKMFTDSLVEGQEVEIEGLATPGIIHKDGLLLTGSDGKKLNVARLSVDGKMMSASKYGAAAEATETVELTAEEQEIANKLRDTWKAILNIEIADDTDFFKAGAGSMDVVRLVEETKEKAGVSLENEDVYMATTFQEFIQVMVMRMRGGDAKPVFEYDAIKMHVNNMDIEFPHQLFIDGQFVDATSGKYLKSINPATEE
ncbi:hypothetical protein OTU49_017400, partial [Cherax quadricarinatus]